MKKITFMMIVLFLMSCLWGCAIDSQLDTRMLACVVETPGCTVENNGQWVQPGESAVFTLDLKDGYSLSGTDYSGSYSTVVKNGKIELTLENVQYPVRVELALTSSFASITYLPNEGAGEVIEVSYGLTDHLRPNTSIGTDRFSRVGYTLVCWNTAPDGSGLRVGLGSRVTVENTLTLYAQWVSWTDKEDFRYTRTQDNTITIEAYLGEDGSVAVPARIEDCDVTAIAAGAFAGSMVKHVVLPATMEHVMPEAFRDSALETITLFDNIQMISDDAFEGCTELQTLYINAIEAPYGYDYRKESVYADKVDLLIAAHGKQKMVFYGGCSVWYNLDGMTAHDAFGNQYTIINMGLNGTVSSAAQMQIMGAFLEEGDILLHTLELTSQQQLLSVTNMSEADDKLWCGLEYNYDLVSLLDLRTIDGVFDSLCSYLEMKKSQTTYQQYYVDINGERYMDEYGCVPFYRDITNRQLIDMVRLNPGYIDQASMERLGNYYNCFQDQGIRVYVSYACVNIDEVPEEERGNVALMDNLIREAVGAMDSAVLISDLSHYLYEYEDFYDTNYHLITDQVIMNTERWVQDLKTQMVTDGLWEDS